MRASPFFSKLEDQGKVLVFGHRGLSRYYPENTIVSFEKCAENPNIDAVELDVHLCASGEVVVAHDFSLKRTAGIDREIESVTFDELRDIDVGSFKSPAFSSARVPLLSELFRTFGDRFIYDVEIKVRAGKVNRELCAKTYDLIKAFKLQDNVLVSSFNPFALRTFNRISGGRLPSADIFEHSDSIPKILRNGAGHLVSHSSYQKPRFSQVDEDYLNKHGRLPVITWTVNERDEAMRLLSLNKSKMHVFGLIGDDANMLSDVVSHYRD